jgi:hypothetical protein
MWFTGSLMPLCKLGLFPIISLSELHMNGTLGALLEEQVRDRLSLTNAQVATPMLEREVIEHKEELDVNTVKQ